MSKLSNQAARQAKSSTHARVDQQQHAPVEVRRFQRDSPPTTTGKLLLEVARFAAENMAFTQQGDMQAAARARDHLLHIRELVGRRLAELPVIEGDSGSAAP
jgi:hypothetical protein